VRGISDVGTSTSKKQALPTIAKTHDVRVVHCRQPTGLPIFTLTDYIAAVQRHHPAAASAAGPRQPARRDFASSSRSSRKDGLRRPRRVLHDTVVLKGATVEPARAAIRSLLCPTAYLNAAR
jgi:hypothetical protein